MFFRNKKTKELVELIYSDQHFCVYVPINEGLDPEQESHEIEGKIFYGTKKEFKNYWVKSKKTNLLPLDIDLAYEIVRTIKFDTTRLHEDLDNLILETDILYANREQIQNTAKVPQEEQSE